MTLRNSNLRLYNKLQKCHDKVMSGKGRRQDISTLKSVKEYIKTYRRIVEGENKDALHLY